jgi:hypothetical protein
VRRANIRLHLTAPRAVSNLGRADSRVVMCTFVTLVSRTLLRTSTGGGHHAHVGALRRAAIRPRSRLNLRRQTELELM